MSLDLQGSLRFWVFLIVLIVLFLAVLFRPERIRQWPRLWWAASLLAIILFLDGVPPLFFSPSLGGTPAAGAATRMETLMAATQEYLTAVKVITFLQHAGLAAALLFAFSAFFDVRVPSDQRVPRKAEPAPPPRTDAVRPAAPSPRTGEDTCLSCGQRIPPDAARCPACGWTWSNEETANG
jgi:hypothetical protein